MGRPIPESAANPLFSYVGIVAGLLIPGPGELKIGEGVITGFTKHGINQAISRDGVGVATQAIMDAVKNPLKTVGQSEGRIKYIGNQATVVLNREGKVISTWARTSAAWRIRP